MKVNYFLKGETSYEYLTTILKATKAPNVGDIIQLNVIGVHPKATLSLGNMEVVYREWQHNQTSDAMESITINVYMKKMEEVKTS